MQVDIRKDVIIQLARQIPVSQHRLLPHHLFDHVGVISGCFHF